LASSRGYIEKEGRSSTERNSSLPACGHPFLFTSGRGNNPYYFGSDGGVHTFIPDGTGWSCAYCCHMPFLLRAAVVVLVEIRKSYQTETIDNREAALA